MLGSPAGPGGASQRGLWPLAPAPAPPAPSFTTEGFGRYGVYSLFPGGPNLGGALYSHASAIGRFASGIPPSSGAPFHTTHKESLFSSTGYTFGSPTPPPGSPYSPVAATQLELLTKGFNSNIIIHQPDFPLSPKKLSSDKRCEEKCFLVKSEKPCSCQGSSPIKTKFTSEITSGCSRTNPIDWSPVNVKKEPGATPCQVAEISTSVSPIVKIEVTSPTQKNSEISLAAMPSVVTTNGNIPVGIAVARQRVQHHDIVSSPSLPPAGLLTTVNTTTHIKELARLSELDSTPGMAASTTGGVAGGGAVLHCTEDRTAGLAGWSVGGSHNSTIATPTLWQYPATALPVEPMVPLPPVGVQLVRDPTSGHLLLLPATGLEQVQQAVVWPSYHQPSSVLLPPLPPPPLQLLGSASSDYLSTSTTLHQHTQTHSTRLVAVTTTDAKRKIPLPIPATTLIKIETDATTLDQTKTLQAVSTIASNTGTVFTDQSMAPLVTTHVIYQHPTNLILSQTPTAETSCRSQATSPVACLTPPPESTPTMEDDTIPGVQDASNQTDSPICSEDDTTTHAICEVVGETKAKELKEVEYRPNLVTVPEKLPEASKIAEVIEFPSPVPQEQEEAEEENEINQAQQEPIICQKPDLSGLELLSNSIVEFENCRNNINNISAVKQEKQESEVPEQGDVILQRIRHMSIKDREAESVIKNTVDDKLGGLDLLCALAEQRFMEEVEVKNNVPSNLPVPPLHIRPKEKTKDWEREERKKEKRKAKKYLDEIKHKRIKTDDSYKKYRSEDRKNKHEVNFAKQSVSEKSTRGRDKVNGNFKEVLNIKQNGEKCSCKEGDHRTYKSRESEEGVKKYIASKSQPSYTKDDWPEMNAMELDMRMKLAELQRQYKEKQRELHKLKPKRKSLDEKESKKRKSRKKSTHSDRSATPPPLLDKMDIPVTPNKNVELLKPPTLCAIGSQETTKETSKVPKLNPVKQPIVQKPDQNNRQYSPGPDLSDSTPEKTSSSQKRKVGRPKKLMSSCGQRTATETIVAKKPKAGSLVGYLLAAKQKLQMQNKNAVVYSNSPPRYVEETTKKTKSHKTKNNNNNNNNNIIMHTPPLNSVERAKKYSEKSSNIRPKLKAEPMVKTYTEEEEVNNDWDHANEVEDEQEEEQEEEEEIEPEEDIPVSKPKEVEPPEEIVQPVPVIEETPVEEEAAVEEEEEEEEPKPAEEEEEEPPKKVDNRCILSTEHLEKDKLRVLTAMGGLFYAGHLNAVEPPDVYSITLDGERGNRPHIMSREEILRDAIVEVSPASTEELSVGTRLCAYWSQQYRCLYPGSVAEPGTPDPSLDSKFVAVEFDDGDSGTIAIEDIRLLPPDYPIMEYDPNPLLSLSKRRRRISVTSGSTEERRQSQGLASVTSSTTVIQEPQKTTPKETEKENNEVTTTTEEHRERKRMKKKKREKLKQKLAHNDKKKKKKHKCNDEHCKHKKHHKKHRKHKKHHHDKDVEEKKEVEEQNEDEEEEEVDVLNEEEEEEVEEQNEEASEEVAEDQDEEELSDNIPEYQTSPDDEVTMDDILKAKPKKSKKIRDRQESCESRSKMTAFLPARQLWSWSGKGYRRPRAKGRSRKQFFKAIQRGKESIMVGDSAVFLSTGRPDRPYIGRIEAMWESCGKMVVKVKWFYHPEETNGCPTLKYPGALFESPHMDENDVQTISHKCEVLPLKNYRQKLGDDPRRYAAIYDNNDIYYLAGYYDPGVTTLKIQPDIPFNTD